MRTRLTWPRLTLLIIVAVAASAVAALALAERHLKAPLLRVIAARTGRTIRIEGALEVQLFTLHPTLTAAGVNIGNPPWMPSGTTATIGRLFIRFEWHLSRHPIGVQRLEMQQASLYLARNAQAQANWHMHATGPGAGPPLIRSLSLPDAHVELQDGRRHLQFIGTVSAGDPSALTATEFRIHGAGQLNGRPASFQVTGDALSQVQRSQPYSFRFEEVSNTSRLTGQGTLAAPFDFRVLQSRFEARGPDMKDLYYLVGLGFPHTGPYRLSGRLTRQNRRFVYSELAASSGASDMSGALTVDSSGAGHSLIEGSLSSRTLHLADLGARAAGLTPDSTGDASLRLPVTAFRVTALQRADTHIQYSARELSAGPLSLRALSGVVRITHGVLSVEAFKAMVADGSLAGNARFDSAGATPRAELNLTVSDVDVAQLQRQPAAPDLSGRVSGRVQIHALGNSLHQLAASANGTITAVIPHGAMKTSLADLAALDLVGAVRSRHQATQQIALHCAIADLEARDGVLTARSFVIDTDTVLITGSGDLHMDSESLDFNFSGQPKKEPLMLHSQIALQGTLRAPRLRRIGHTALAAALNVLIKPIAGALAAVDPKLMHDADCAALMAPAGSLAGTLTP